MYADLRAPLAVNAKRANTKPASQILLRRLFYNSKGNKNVKLCVLWLNPSIFEYLARGTYRHSSSFLNLSENRATFW